MNIPEGLPTLSSGAHRPGDGKACVMEYVALLAGEAWTDTPTCTYRPLARAAQVVNDRLRDEDRHLLVPLIGRLFGTTAPVDDRAFARFAAMSVLPIAREVEYLHPAAKACNDATERYWRGEASLDDLRAASYAAAAYAAAYAADAAYAYAAAAERLVGWLSCLIDEYDRLSGRTEHRDVTDTDLRVLAEAVAR